MSWVEKLKDMVKNYFYSQRKKTLAQTDANLMQQGYTQKDITHMRNRDRQQAQQRELMSQMGK
jgi:hypothetical protein